MKELCLACIGFVLEFAVFYAVGSLLTRILKMKKDVSLTFILGNGIGKKLSADFKTKLNMILSCCAFTMGISSICLMKNMPPVIFSVIVGTAIGLALHLGDWIQKGAVQMNRLIMGLFSRTGDEKADKEFTAAMITVIVLTALPFSLKYCSKSRRNV